VLLQSRKRAQTIHNISYGKFLQNHEVRNAIRIDNWRNNQLMGNNEDDDICGSRTQRNQKSISMITAFKSSVLCYTFWKLRLLLPLPHFKCWARNNDTKLCSFCPGLSENVMFCAQISHQGNARTMFPIALRFEKVGINRVTFVTNSTEILLSRSHCPPS